MQETKEKGDELKTLKCRKCFNNARRFAPVLVQSGHQDPIELICPICGTYHNSQGEKREKKDRDRIIAQKESIAKYRDHWFNS